MKKYRIKAGKHMHLDHVDPDDTGGWDKGKAKEHTEKLLEKLDELQGKLYAEGKRSLLIVLQAMDTAGKDGTIRHVMSGVNPQGCHVAAFKVPSTEERAHDFLWRIHREVPARGQIGIFNRSHYEDVLVTRVHKLITDDEAEKRFKDIHAFEKTLTRHGMTILKFYLHISKDEQRKRLQSRLENPEKQWKFSLNDLQERKHWKAYQKAYEEALAKTSTSFAPWYVIPANHKWYRNLVIAEIIVETLKGMDPTYPPPTAGIDFKKIKVQ